MWTALEHTDGASQMSVLQWTALVLELSKSINILNGAGIFMLCDNNEINFKQGLVTLKLFYNRIKPVINDVLYVLLAFTNTCTPK